MIRNKKGFSMVELLIVMSILAILIMATIMAINPIVQVGKAHDAQRKKDLKKISASFEEYFNDMGCYPKTEVPGLMNPNNCGSMSVFSSWLRPWPCDPQKIPYQILVEDVVCPKWFKVLTKLEYEADPDIPVNIKKPAVPHAYPLTYNFGVSSTNINWNEVGKCPPLMSGSVPSVQLCFEIAGSICSNTPSSCVGPNCFADTSCSMECQMECCGVGCPTP